MRFIESLVRSRPRSATVGPGFRPVPPSRRGKGARGLGLLGPAAALAMLVAACGGSTPTPTVAPTATARPAPTATQVPSVAPTATTRPAAGATPAPAGATATAAPRPTATAQPTATARPAPTATPVPTVTPIAAQPKYGGTLLARWFNETPQWDTYTTAFFYTTGFMQQLLNNLIRLKKDSLNEIQPDLAEKWEASSDGKVFTFTLRKDAKWQDGKPVTSADIAYNLKRAADPRYTFNKDVVAPVSSVDTPDPYTVRVTLNRVSAAFIPRIAGPYMLMYPAQYPDMAVWQKAPVGSGAFSFKAQNPNATYEFTKNGAYWGKGSAGRALPYLDAITYYVMPDKALALASFRAGRIHCGCAYDSDFMDQAESQIRREIPGAKLTRFLGPRLDMNFNLKRPPFDNLAFRQAFAIGLDKQKLAATVLEGNSYWPTPPLVAPELGGKWGLTKEELAKIPGFNPNHAADLAIAQQKLKESGIDPKTVSLQILASAFYEQVMDALASIATTDLGLNTTAHIATTAESNQRRRDGNFIMYHSSPSEVLDDPGDRYVTFMLSNGAANDFGWKNARVDQLLREQDSEVDVAKRRAMLWEVQRIHLTEFPSLPLLQTRQVRGTRPEVFGFFGGLVNTSSAFRLEEVWLEK